MRYKRGALRVKLTEKGRPAKTLDFDDFIYYIPEIIVLLVFLIDVIAWFEVSYVYCVKLVVREHKKIFQQSAVCTFSCVLFQVRPDEEQFSYSQSCPPTIFLKTLNSKKRQDRKVAYRRSSVDG